MDLSLESVPFFAKNIVVFVFVFAFVLVSAFSLAEIGLKEILL